MVDKQNPYADGRIGSTADAVARSIVVGIAIVVAWNAPYAWYWRLAIFVGIMSVLGVVYPTIQLALARQVGVEGQLQAEDNSRRRLLLVRNLGPVAIACVLGFVLVSIGVWLADTQRHSAVDTARPGSVSNYFDPFDAPRKDDGIFVDWKLDKLLSE